MKFIDISLPIRDGMMTYPQNPAVNIVRAPHPSARISRITVGSHTGTHIDAPLHVLAKGRGVDVYPLAQLSGPARVLDCTAVSEMIMPDHLKRFQIRRGQRILLKTKNSLRGFKKFRRDAIGINGNSARYLAGCGIQLVGIDSLSIKRPGVDDPEAHLALLRKRIPILEGLNLSKVNPGTYDLLCLPLLLPGLDGAPCRAVLVENLEFRK